MNSLFKKICDVTCTSRQLKAFVTDIDKKEFDLDNPFDKYYNLESILRAIARYEQNEIDDRFLARWMNAYNWIIMGGFDAYQGGPITFKRWVMRDISEFLDGLSFFNCGPKDYDLEKFKIAFEIRDKIFSNLDDWKRIFAHTDEWGDNEDDVAVLASNDKTKEFAILYGEMDYLHHEVDFPRVELDRLEKEIAVLREKGYKELKSGLWDIEDEEEEIW